MNWWDLHVPSRLERWAQDIGGANAKSRVLIREIIAEHNFKSVLDVGCGLAIDSMNIERIGASYCGVDASSYLTAQAAERGAKVWHGRADALPFGDLAFDFSFTRHAIEYASEPELALNEMVRVSGQGVAVVLGEKPGKSDRIDVAREPEWTCWSAKRYERFLESHTRVAYWDWMPVGGAEGIGGNQEMILNVMLK